jgi:hypothetical protein
MFNQLPRITVWLIQTVSYSEFTVAPKHDKLHQYIPHAMGLMKRYSSSGELQTSLIVTENNNSVVKLIPNGQS